MDLLVKNSRQNVVNFVIRHQTGFLFLKGLQQPVIKRCFKALSKTGYGLTIRYFNSLPDKPGLPNSQNLIHKRLNEMLMASFESLARTFSLLARLFSLLARTCSMLARTYSPCP